MPQVEKYFVKPVRKLSAIVLAGGKSSRMGQDKALMQVGDVSLLQRVCQVAQQCSDAVYVVTPWIERYRSQVNPPIHFIQEQPLAASETSPHGPLVGFAQALQQIQLQQIRSEWVLLLACDLPYLQAEVLQGWIDQLPAIAEAPIALLPQNPQGWWEPLCGFYQPRCLPDLEIFIRQGGRSFQRWLATQMVQPLPLVDPHMLFNCNTPQDFSQI